MVYHDQLLVLWRQIHSTTEGSTLVVHLTGFPCCSLVMWHPVTEYLRTTSVRVGAQYLHCQVALWLHWVVLRSYSAVGGTLKIVILLYSLIADCFDGYHILLIKGIKGDDNNIFFHFLIKGNTFCWISVFKTKQYPKYLRLWECTFNKKAKIWTLPFTFVRENVYKLHEIR